MLSRCHGDEFTFDWLLTINLLIGQRPADALAADDLGAVLQAAQLVQDSDMLDEMDES